MTQTGPLSLAVAKTWIFATEKARFTRVDQLGLEHLVLYLLDDRSGDLYC